MRSMAGNWVQWPQLRSYDRASNTRYAFDAGETRCEKLGAVHLLAHGIWAFKASGPKAATDLVFPEPIGDHLGTIQRTASALVLTEWKLVTDPTKIDSVAHQAREQAARYESGLLGALELKRTRYVVLVTTDDGAKSPDDVTSQGIAFRHVVIPVKPRSASVVRGGGAGRKSKG
jgi:hypothetical protein